MLSRIGEPLLCWSFLLHSRYVVVGTQFWSSLDVYWRHGRRALVEPVPKGTWRYKVEEDKTCPSTMVNDHSKELVKQGFAGQGLIDQGIRTKTCWIESIGFGPVGPPSRQK